MIRRGRWMWAALALGTVSVASAKEVILRFEDASEIPATLWRLGLTDLGRLGENSNWVRASASASLAKRLLQSAEIEDGVQAFDGDLNVNQLNAFTPDDTWFFPVFDGNIIMYYGQWGFKNNVGGAIDVNVWPAWQNDWTGEGVRVANIDDGLDVAHPDLAPNLDLANSFDFEFNIVDPNHKLGEEGHGSCTAGIMAARGGNGIGVTGMAPLATLVGLRCGFVSGSANLSAQLAAATLYRSSGSNRTINVKNHSYGPASPYVNVDIEYAALSDSARAGTIHCVAAGNGRGTTGQDANKRMIATNPDVIAVAGLDLTGTFTTFSNFGANVTCATPTRNGNLPGIASTDRVGTPGYNGLTGTDDYAYFGGTSASTPIVAGAMALLKQMNPNATTRLARHLIARSARLVNSNDASSTSDGGWRTNSAGFRFNQNYGFGLLDTAGMLSQGTKWTGTTPQLVLDSGLMSVGTAVPDNNASGINIPITFNSPWSVEAVQVTLNATHPARGQLIVRLTSPSGYSSRLSIGSSSDNVPNINWTYLALPFFGERASGTWTLNVRDGLAGSTGSVDSVRVRVLCGAPTTSKAVKGTVNMGEAVADGRPVNGTIRLWYPNDRGQAAVSVPVTLSPGADPTRSVVDVLGALPEGQFDLEIAAPPYLNRRVRNVNTAQAITDLNWMLVPGDSNGDGEVNILDYVLLSDSFAKEAGMEGFQDSTDLDRDGLTTILDYLILSNNFGLVGD